jgi:predicted nuclease of predicted toxin-antitoxin system
MRLLADENLDARILEGLRGRPELIDLARVHDVGLIRTPDPIILQWAAERGWIVLTHDVRTMPGFALDRVRRGEPMPGVIVVSKLIGIGRAIADLMVMIVCGNDEDFNGQVKYIPL